MLDFFIALFGGSYYYGKCCQESNIKKKNELKQEQRMQKMRTIWDSGKLMQIRSRFVADPHAALEEIGDELYYIFSDYDWRVLFREWPFFEQYDLTVNNGFFSIWQVAYCVYAAKHGQVLSWYTEYQASPICKMLGISSERNESLAKSIATSACKMIDHCLREFYGDDEDYRLMSYMGCGNYCKLGIMVMYPDKDFYPISSDINVAEFAENVRNKLVKQYVQKAVHGQNNAPQYFQSIQQTQTR